MIADAPAITKVDILVAFATAIGAGDADGYARNRDLQINYGDAKVTNFHVAGDFDLNGVAGGLAIDD